MAHHERPIPDQHAVNIGELERWASGVGGGMLVAGGIARRSLGGVLMAFAGGLLLDRGLTGRSRAYAALGISTADRPSEPAPAARGRTEPQGETAAGARRRAASRAGEHPEEEDVVQEASEESFPASDSPAWTPDSHIGTPPQRKPRTPSDEDRG